MNKLFVHKDIAKIFFVAIIVLALFPSGTLFGAGTPDLHVTSASVSPQNAAIGEVVAIEAIIKNGGDANTGVGFYTSFRVDGVLIEEDLSSSLGKGGTRTKNVTWTASGIGTHTIEICADSRGDVLESDENNNCREKTVTVEAPDLIVSSASVSPKNADVGENVDFEITIKNTGGTNTGGGFNVRFRVDGEGQELWSTSQLGSGKERSRTFSWTAHTPGEHTLRVCADAGDNVLESNEDNNCKEKTVTVKTPTSSCSSANGTSLNSQEFKNAIDSGLITYSNLVVKPGDTTATFTINNQTNCTAPLSLSAYKRFDDLFLSTQKFYDGTGIVNVGESAVLTVDLPSCSVQVDAWYGLHPQNLLNSNPYAYPNNPWVIDFDWTSAPLCQTTTNPPASCDAFSANPTTINKGGSSTLNWDTTNATSVSIDNGIGSVSADGSKTVSPSVTTTYTLTAVGAGGNDTCTAKVTVNPITNPPASCDAFSANPTSITSGGSSTLSWNTTNATSVSISGGVGAVAEDGSVSVSPTSNTTYTLTAVGTGGNDTCTADVNVDPPSSPKADVSITKSVTPGSGSIGQVFTYTLTYKNNGALAAQSVAIADVASPVGKLSSYTITKSPNHGSCNSKSNGITCSLGTLKVGESGTITYTAVGVNTGTIDNTVVISTPTPETTLSNNQDDARVVITSTTNPPASCDSFGASPSSISSGGSSTLTWGTTNATSVAIDNGVGNVSDDGSTSVSPNTNTTYTLTATGVGGNDTCTASVTITTTTPPPSCTLVANPSVVSPGGSTTLTWTTTNSTSASINQGIGAVTPVAGGSTSATGITSNTTYTLTATGPGGSTTCPASVTVSSTPLADVAITKDVTPNKVEVGGVFTYTLNYSNLGTLDAVSTTISDIATPTGLLNNYTITSGPAHGTCTANTNGISCSLGTLPAGASGTVVYKATGIAVGIINNTATITTTTTETTLANNSDTESVSVFVPEDPPCTVNCGGGYNPPRVVMFSKPGDDQPFASQSFVYLSQIPYTGVSADVKQVLFIIFLSLWSVAVAYLIIRKWKKGELLTNSGSVITPNSDRSSTKVKEERALSIMELVKEKKEEVFSQQKDLSKIKSVLPNEIAQDQKDNSVEPKTVSFNGNNLPVDSKSQDEYGGVEMKVEVDKNLEQQARERGVLISESALNLIKVPLATGDKERMEVLNSIINIALTMYPRDDGWVVLDRKRIENVIFSPRYDVVAIFSDWLSEGESKKVFAFLRLLRSHKVSVKEFLKKVAYFIDNLYRCRIGESLDNSNTVLDLENQCTSWSTKDIQQIVGILVNGVDESYASEDASVKLAIVKILEISNKSKTEGKSYYKA